MLVENPEEDKISLMNKQKCLCNGEETGKQCQHYWVFIHKVESNNPASLRMGEVKRVCLISSAYPIEMASDEMAVMCNMYQSSNRDYTPETEQYNPVTPEEYKKLHQENGIELKPFKPTPSVTLPVVDATVQAAVQQFLNEDDKQND